MTSLKESCVVLKKGREKAIHNRHHWIFSGAVEFLPTFNNGDILKVYSSDKELLGSAYFNNRSSIIGRMVAFGDIDPIENIKRLLNRALKLREKLFENTCTNGYRLVNGEGDSLPGLIIDRYNDVLVIQITTLGMEKLKKTVVDCLVKNLTPRSIYEKSNVPARKDEGLSPFAGLIFGEDVSVVKISENGLSFQVDIKGGQKTGFFFDQREMRKQVGALAKNKKVLNCFSYTGGFSVYASAGGAIRVDSVDLSQAAIDLASQNVANNHLDLSQHSFLAEDAFEYLHKASLDYELVILDPPAFAKKQKDIIAACRGYKEINRIAMKKMPAGSLLLTCSCSFHVNAELFQKVLFQAAAEAGRQVRIVGRHILAADHPINIFHPEGDYLKSLLLYIE